jgi:hypothetical protein
VVDAKLDALYEQFKLFDFFDRISPEMKIKSTVEGTAVVVKRSFFTAPSRNALWALKLRHGGSKLPSR